MEVASVLGIAPPLKYRREGHFNPRCRSLWRAGRCQPGAVSAPESRILAGWRGTSKLASGACVHLRRVEGLDHRRERPDVPERIRDLSVAVAVERVRNGHLRGRSGLDRATERAIDVVHVELEDD